VCNEDETEPCLKLKMLQFLCERKCFRPLVEGITRSECGPTSSNLGPYLGPQPRALPRPFGLLHLE
jgi:hypothetical protein